MGGGTDTRRSGPQLSLLRHELHFKAWTRRTSICAATHVQPTPHHVITKRSISGRLALVSHLDLNLTISAADQSGAAPTPQPSPLATLRRPPEVLPLYRNAQCDRQSRRVRTGGAIHERHTRDAAVWILKGQHTDSRPAGRESAEVHGIQRAGR